MNDNQKKELMIFFTALATIAVIFIVGLRYSKTSGGSSSGGLLADIGSDIPTEGGISPAPATPIPVPVIASSSIVITSSTASSSSAKSIPIPAKDLPYSASTFKILDWHKAWGNVAVADGFLDLQASASSTGADTFLNGSEEWKNYDFETDVDWISGQTFAVVAREKDLNDYVYCDFGTGEATIIERDGGNNTVIGSEHSPNHAAGAIYDFGIHVYGDDVDCTVNGQEVAAATMGTDGSMAGGIGFIAWDPATSTASVEIQKIAISPLASNDIVVPFTPPVISTPSVPSSTSKPVAPVSVESSTPVQVVAPPPPAALTLPYYETNFATDTNWFAKWGTFTIDPSSNALDIESTSTTSGATVILKNSTAWTNYTFDASLDWVKGQTFGLVARYINSRNFVACEFDEVDPGDLKIQLQQTVNGQNNILVTGYVSDYSPAPGSFVDAFITVDNTTGICSLDHHVVSNQISNAYLINAPFNGGIGFTMGDPAINNTEVDVQSISVIPTPN